VETSAQAEYLMNLECDSLQGFLFSRPVPEAALERAVAHSVQTIVELRDYRVSGEL
jgi:EAL domain-containing protein (putative c-di-GMP-specific phosphodiesterase class I)